MLVPRSGPNISGNSVRISIRRGDIRRSSEKQSYVRDSLLQDSAVQWDRRLRLRELKIREAASGDQFNSLKLSSLPQRQQALLRRLPRERQPLWACQAWAA